MSKNNAKILLVLVAIACLAGAYFYVYKDNISKKDSFESEYKTLETRYNELKAKEEKREVYVAETKAYSEEVLKVVNKYPVSLEEENIIMLVKGFLKDNEEGKIDINSIAMNEPTDYYVIPGIIDETGEFNEGYTCYSVELPLPYTGTYKGVKDFIEYIQTHDNKMTISTANIAPADMEADEYSGNLQITMYCIAGPNREAEDIELEDGINHGVENLFQGGANANPVEVFKHDYDNGDSIKTANDFQIVLNNANNDLVDGVIVASAKNEGSQVSDGTNGPVKVDVEVTGADDAYTYTYTIGTNSYTGTIENDELTIYVNSSERVDADDKNSVELNIKNGTELPVFIKVTGDDKTSPRFAVGSKEGTVKVY